MALTDTREVDALVVDYGGVLTTSVRASFAQWCEADGITQDSLRALLREWLGARAEEGNPIHRMETGELDTREFERHLVSRLVTVDGRAVEPSGLLRRMFAGVGPDEAMLDLLRDARKAGLRTALLSNSWGRGYPLELLHELCDVVVISGDIGLRKPDTPIYEHTLRLLELPADRCVFVDDAEANVLAARAVGMHAVWHKDAPGTIAEIAKLVPALSGGAA
ncbi:putative hydrolase of the HAD superfamily [Crossiella equi]|uniref:Hydrolase of the HAD superfamily n=1 Tax=Crossiella equi TaxID=130796 RepID=A0ABS5A5A5_9PSEU|nr:HAD family phosphatase [Crossiella equi]MBP2471462.1 putative hydrolase of the HAD superfamily [Crossiella equi]